MKALEDAVIPLVGPMGDGWHKTLDVLQQWAIARWALAKAMVWEFITVGHEIFYSKEERVLLKSGTIPPNTVVWLAGHVGRETFYAAGNRASSRSGVVPHLEGYFTTMAYKRLVVQVMSIRPYEHTDPYTLLDCDQATFANAIVRIWPTTSQSFWPPTDILADNMLQSFHKRCGGSTVKG
jgi:hypothetical protein